MESRLRDFLKSKEKEGLLRKLNKISFLKEGRLSVEGKEYINFSSNDYLGLSSHPDIISRAQKAQNARVGASASRLMTGSTELHHKLEKEIALFKGKPEALVFNSGYQANVGIISALFGKGDAVFSDRLNHASIIDGIRLSGAKLFRFKHNDMQHLEKLLKKERNSFRNALIVTETVFSMDGDVAPVEEISDLKEKHNALFMVDEAHATGIFGHTGSGIAEERQLTGKIDIIMGTFSKAFGSFGAYAATSREIKEYLINCCRSFIYSTALPPSVIAANIAGLEIIKKEPGRRKKLLENASIFRAKLKNNGLNVLGETQIVPVIVGGNDEAVRVSDLLRKEGFWVLPVRPPTVPEGRARIRISVTSDHSKEDINEFAEAIIRIVKK